MKKQIYQSNPVGLFISVLMICLCVSVTRAQDLPAHWESVDIGDVATAGTASFADDVFTVNGSGADIWFTADAFQYAYQPARGDCEISAYVASITETAGDAKACVMIRETLDANSAFAMAVVCPGASFGTYFQWRPATESECDNTNLAYPHPAPVWLKLVREGDDFTAYMSEDGITWTTEGDPVEIEMPDDVFIGLGVCAHNNDGSLCETRFESVVVDPGIDYTGLNKLTSDELSVYPNPVSDILTVNLNNNGSGSACLTIYNCLGKIVMNETLTGSKHILDLEALPKGVYLIKLTGGQEEIIGKIIKK